MERKKTPKSRKHRVSYRINPKRPRYNVIKMAKIKDRKRVLKISESNKLHTRVLP